jgi:hypothetical protein
MPDEVPVDISGELRLFGLEFFDIVLAKMSETSVVGLEDLGHGFGLADCHQTY